MPCGPAFVTDPYNGFLMQTFSQFVLTKSFWAFEHLFFPFVLTNMFNRMFPLNIVVHVMYYIVLFSLVYILGVGWEFFEFFASIVGLPWFQEIENKKMMDIFQNTIGISLALISIHFSGLYYWKYDWTHTAVQTIFILVMLFPTGYLPDVYYVLDTCKPDGFNGTTYNYNTIFTTGINVIPVGFLTYCLILIIMIALSYMVSINYNPENNTQSIKMMILTYIFLAMLIVGNFFWAYSTYITCWIVAFLFFLVLLVIGYDNLLYKDITWFQPKNKNDSDEFQKMNQSNPKKKKNKVENII